MKQSIKNLAVYFSLSLLVMLTGLQAFAQVPQLFNYQGIARDVKGNPLSNQTMTLKLAVLPTSDATVAEYEETQSVKTNEFGLYTLQIGNGSSTSLRTLKDVKWETGNKYIKVSIDPNGGSNFEDAGTNQLLSVPYAIYADKAGVAANSGNDKTRSGGVDSDAPHAAADANYLTRFTAFNEIGKSSFYQNPSTGNIGLGTATPSALAKLHIFQNVGNQEFLRMQNTDPNAFGKFIMYNNNASSYATLTKYGTTYAGGYVGISSLYPFANLLTFGNNSSSTGNGRFLISSAGNIGVSLSKSGTSKLKFHADFLTENVGIGGNAIPVSRVHLNNTDSSIMDVRITNTITGHTAADGLLITQNGNTASIMNRENNSLSMGTNNNTKITIISAGNVGVNTMVPSATTQLDVNGNGSATGVHATANQQTVAQTQAAITGQWGITLPYTESIAIFGEAKASGVFPNGNNIGVAGSAMLGTSPQNNIGVMGEAGNAPGYNHAVVGVVKGPATAGNFAISGSAPVAPNSYAGYFIGKVRIGDGTEAPDRVFTSDISGIGSWTDVCTLPCITSLSTSVTAAGNDWKLSGNNVTAIGSYLGTNDNFPLQFKVNSVHSGILDPTKHNTYLGYDAGTANLPIPGATDNTGIGFNALKNNISYRNTAIGQIALEQNTTGFQNTAIGDQALRNNISGINNTSVGHQSMHDNVNGNNNSALGINALFANTSGNDNSAIGFATLGSNTTGDWNVAHGTYALAANTAGGANVAIGGNSLQQTTIGSDNTAMGHNAMFGNTIGNRNIAIGREAMLLANTGSDNTLLGAYSNILSGNLNFATALGAGATVGQSNSLIIGRTAPSVIDRVGINTSAPHSALQVVGSFATNIKSIQANTAATIDDYTFICLAPLTVTLPDPITCKGRIYVIKRNSPLALITITTASGVAFIDMPSGFGVSASPILNNSSQIGVTYQSDGNGWIKIATAE